VARKFAGKGQTPVAYLDCQYRLRMSQTDVERWKLLGRSPNIIPAHEYRLYNSIILAP
jgi:hypothetical protein